MNLSWSNDRATFFSPIPRNPPTPTITGGDLAVLAEQHVVDVADGLVVGVYDVLVEQRRCGNLVTHGLRIPVLRAAHLRIVENDLVVTSDATKESLQAAPAYDSSMKAR